VQKQFFPASARLELLVDLWLPQGSSLKATEAQATKVEQKLLSDPEMKKSIKDFVSYIGNGSPRFYLPLDQQLFNDNFAQLVVVTKDIEAREDLKKRLETYFATDSAEGGLAGGFANIRARVLRLENGPPVGFPIQFRVSGEDLTELRHAAEQVATVMRANPHVKDVNFDWNEMGKAIRLDVDQDRARALGISTLDLSNSINLLLSGTTITQMREGDQLVDVVVRASGDERARISALEDINIRTATERYVPLAQVAKVDYELENVLDQSASQPPADHHRARRHPRQRAGAGRLGADRSAAERRARASCRRASALNSAARPRIGQGRELDQGRHAVDADGRRHLLMIQLQSIGRTVLVLLTAPLGLIGVAIALLSVQRALRFRRQPRRDRVVRHDHAQLGDPRRSDRAGRKGRQDDLGSDRRIDRPPLPPDHADRCRGDPRHDPAYAQRFLGADGRGDHGRADRGDAPDRLLPARALRGVVSGEAGRGGGLIQKIVTRASASRA
jgi:multidrug efflux pump